MKCNYDLKGDYRPLTLEDLNKSIKALNIAEEGLFGIPSGFDPVEFDRIMRLKARAYFFDEQRKMKKTNILLDMDGVIADFTSAALKALNKEFNKNITLDNYIDYGKWGIWEPYGTTPEEFWRVINSTPGMYTNIRPIPWFRKLHAKLSSIGEVTIVTAPSFGMPSCATQKYEWLKKYLGIDADSVVVCFRKRLLSGNGILIDDNKENVDKFIENGGQAILIPSVWNTRGLTFEMVWAEIEKGLAKWGIII